MDSTINDLLAEAKDLIREEMSELSFKTWILPLEINSINDNSIILIAKDQFTKESVEARFKDLITNAFNIILQKNCNVQIVLKDDLQTKEETLSNVTLPNVSYSVNYSNTYLKKDYSFDTFVVGDNNRFAHAAALAVAESPAKAYNPLFLYGGVGLGKTHLMHSIGNEILRNNNHFKILYVTSEKFTNDFVNSIKDNSMEKFKQKYRNIDVLLIDDIQFIAGKKCRGSQG